MYGGIEAPEKDQKVMPCGDIYTMKLYPSKSTISLELLNLNPKSSHKIIAAIFFTFLPKMKRTFHAF